jgi:hypothetical protein
LALKYFKCLNDVPEVKNKVNIALMLSGLNLFCFYIWYLNLNLKPGKGKAVPLQAWSSPEDSRKLWFPDFMTTAQNGGKVVSLKHRPPLPSRNNLVLIFVRG